MRIQKEANIKKISQMGRLIDYTLALPHTVSELKVSCLVAGVGQGGISVQPSSPKAA